MVLFFNEIEPYAAKWLSNLWPGADVNDRDIRSLSKFDVADHDTVHLFAGIGGWQYALELAGWPSEEPVWTGSCPCQPFSNAGKGMGVTDERHLWPEMYRLVSECKPPVVFGEQVASKAGRAWLSGVRSDMEALGYRFGAADLCAASVGAPHIRQRLYWVADSKGLHSYGSDSHRGSIQEERLILPEPRDSGSEKIRKWVHWDADQPGLFEVVDGVQQTVARCRAYGSAIVPQVAAEFIKAYREARQRNRRS